MRSRYGVVRTWTRTPHKNDFINITMTVYRKCFSLFEFDIFTAFAGVLFLNENKKLSQQH